MRRLPLKAVLTFKFLKEMKTVKFFGVAFLTVGALMFTSCSKDDGLAESMTLAEKSGLNLNAAADCCTYDGILSEAEIQGLLKMREEEKLARDVYLYFAEKYNEAIFVNIAQSEQAHMDAILRLLEGYNIDDPALPGSGEFSDAGLADLYLALTSAGDAGLVEALKAGATIEDMDIADLQQLLSEVENENVTLVYGNLLAGSENHLRAFVAVLNTLGATYEPQYITVEDFEAILADQNQKGNKNGKGQGNANGNGYRGANGQNGTANGTGVCDNTQQGLANGNQTGPADGSQAGYQKRKNGNAGGKGNGRS